MDTMTKVLIGLGGFAAGVTLLGIYDHMKAKPTAAAPGLSGASYDSSKAVSVVLNAQGSGPTVGIGSSVQAESQVGQGWYSPGVVSSDTTVLAPSIPGTTNGFVALKAGTATLSGNPSTSTGQGATLSASVTVQ